LIFGWVTWDPHSKRSGCVFVVLLHFLCSLAKKKSSPEFWSRNKVRFVTPGLCGLFLGKASSLGVWVGRNHEIVLMGCFLSVMLGKDTCEAQLAWRLGRSAHPPAAGVSPASVTVHCSAVGEHTASCHGPRAAAFVKDAAGFCFADLGTCIFFSGKCSLASFCPAALFKLLRRGPCALRTSGLLSSLWFFLPKSVPWKKNELVRIVFITCILVRAWCMQCGGCGIYRLPSQLWKYTHIAVHILRRYMHRIQLRYIYRGR
jgi:hypothetical protein